MTASLLASPPRQPAGGEPEQDIMAIGQDGKPPERHVPASRENHAPK
jgi:hypothetical protein